MLNICTLAQARSTCYTFYGTMSDASKCSTLTGSKLIGCEEFDDELFQAASAGSRTQHGGIAGNCTWIRRTVTHAPATGSELPLSPLQKLCIITTISTDRMVQKHDRNCVTPNLHSTIVTSIQAHHCVKGHRKKKLWISQ